MVGYAASELIGQSARILYPSDEDFEFVGREKYRQIAERGTGSVETRFQTEGRHGPRRAALVDAPRSVEPQGRRHVHRPRHHRAQGGGAGPAPGARPAAPDRGHEPGGDRGARPRGPDHLLQRGGRGDPGGETRRGHAAQLRRAGVADQRSRRTALPRGGSALQPRDEDAAGRLGRPARDRDRRRAALHPVHQRRSHHERLGGGRGRRRDARGHHGAAGRRARAPGVRAASGEPDRGLADGRPHVRPAVGRPARLRRRQPGGRPPARRRQQPVRGQDDRGSLPASPGHGGARALPAGSGQRRALGHPAGRLQGWPDRGSVRGVRVPDQARVDGGVLPRHHGEAEGRARRSWIWRRGCASSRSWSRSARSPRASPTRSTTP